MKTAFAALSLLLVIGCASSATSPTADEWSASYGAAWGDVVDCWGVDPEKPRVVVRQDCVLFEGAWDFNVGSEVLGDVWVHGRTVGDTVEVCPDLAALRHEFSEWVKYDAPGGHAYLNGSGKCWL